MSTDPTRTAGDERGELRRLAELAQRGNMQTPRETARHLARGVLALLADVARLETDAKIRSAALHETRDRLAARDELIAEPEAEVSTVRGLLADAETRAAMAEARAALDGATNAGDGSDAE